MPRHFRRGGVPRRDEPPAADNHKAARTSERVVLERRSVRARPTHCLAVAEASQESEAMASSGDDTTDGNASAEPAPFHKPDIYTVQMAAERLKQRVESTPFPDLGASPRDDRELQRTVDVALRWEDTISRAYGVAEDPGGENGPLENILSRFGVLGLLAPPRGPDPLYVHPEDVLGEVPADLRSFRPSRIAATFSYYARMHGPFAVEPSGPRMAFSLTNWETIRSILHDSHEETRSKALSLVRWVEARIEGIGEPPEAVEIRRRLQGAQARIAIEALKKLKSIYADRIARSDLLELTGIPPTAVDHDARTYPMPGYKEGSPSATTFSRECLIDYVLHRWRPRVPRGRKTQ